MLVFRLGLGRTQTDQNMYAIYTPYLLGWQMASVTLFDLMEDGDRLAISGALVACDTWPDPGIGAPGGF